MFVYANLLTYSKYMCKQCMIKPVSPLASAHAPLLRRKMQFLMELRSLRSDWGVSAGVIKGGLLGGEIILMISSGKQTQKKKMSVTHESYLMGCVDSGWLVSLFPFILCF